MFIHLIYYVHYINTWYTIYIPYSRIYAIHMALIFTLLYTDLNLSIDHNSDPFLCMYI